MLLPFQVFKTSICSQRRGHCDYKGIPPFDCCALYNKKMTYLRTSVSKTSASELRHDQVNQCDILYKLLHNTKTILVMGLKN